jgi:hypothetical protein
MKKYALLILLILYNVAVFAQCSMCTKTAAGLDDKSARGLNTGIIYLALLPLALIGIMSYKWYQRNKETI